MIAEESRTLKKKYQRPEIHVTAFELGVFGQYGNPSDPPKPLPDLGIGNSAS